VNVSNYSDRNFRVEAEAASTIESPTSGNSLVSVR
jgi:hypothetical protein